MKLEDIEVVAYLLVEKRFGQEFNRLFFAEGIEKRHLQPEIGDTALYTTEQMQVYAESKVREALSGLRITRGRSSGKFELATVYLESIIDQLFKEEHDE